MQIRIGDEVSFLSEKLDGKVTSIINATTVNVYCDVYGFEIPASIDDLVVTKSTLSETSANSANLSWQNNINTESNNSVYIAIVPDDCNNLQHSLFNLYIVNDTKETVLYTVAAYNGEVYNGISAGNIDSNTYLQLGTYTLKDIETKIKRIVVQYLKYTKRNANWGHPVESEINISIQSLCKSGAYKQCKYFKGIAFIKEIGIKEAKSIEKLIQESEKESTENTPKYITNKTVLKELNSKMHQDQKVKTSPKEQKEVNPNIIEIDLHAEALLETTAGMDNAAILEFQMEIFVKTMEKYKLRKGQKIVFIHGKGEGVLRQRIMWLLQTTYKRHNHQDASFKQYGFGATMVTIR